MKDRGPFTGKATKKYNRRNLRAGDYRGASSSEKLTEALVDNVQWAASGEEQRHAKRQIDYAEAAKAITAEQAERARAAIGSKVARLEGVDPDGNPEDLDWMLK
jgi:hypothetical protein